MENNFYSQQDYGFGAPPVNPDITEKRETRRIATLIGLPLLAFSVITSLWSNVYLAVMAALGYSANAALAIVRDPAVMQVVQVALSILIFTVPYTIAVKVAGYRVSDLVPLTRSEKGTAFPYFLFGIGFCAFANIAVSYAGQIFENMGFDYSVDYGDNPKGFWGFVLVFISTAVVPALVEEFACRGIIMGLLLKYKQGFALIVSSVIFGIMHGNFEQIPFAFLVGLVLGLIRIKTGSLWVCVLVHAFNNFVSVVFDFLPDGNTMAYNMAYTIFLGVCLLAAIFGICKIPNGEKAYSLENETGDFRFKRYKWFFTSPVIIIFAVLAFIESLGFFIME